MAPVNDAAQPVFHRYTQLALAFDGFAVPSVLLFNVMLIIAVFPVSSVVLEAIESLPKVSSRVVHDKKESTGLVDWPLFPVGLDLSAFVSADMA